MLRPLQSSKERRAHLVRRAGTETEVSFAGGEEPVTLAGGVNRLAFDPGEFWPTG